MLTLLYWIETVLSNQSILRFKNCSLLNRKKVYAFKSKNYSSFSKLFKQLDQIQLPCISELITFINLIQKSTKS